MLVVALLTLGGLQAKAQKEETEMGILNHVGIGVGVGVLDGFGFEVAAPVTKFLTLRTGVSLMPKFKYDFDVDIDSDEPALSADQVEVEAKINKADWKLLLDIHPFPGSSFRLTTGFYVGSEKLFSVHNTSQFIDPEGWGTVGVKLGDYRLTSDENGNVSADLRVKSFKPYVGWGIGRAVSKKRLAFCMDMGVQFWGKPSVWTNVKDDFGYTSYKKLEKGDLDNDDVDEVFKIMEKITVCPVISFRLTGRIL